MKLDAVTFARLRRLAPVLVSARGKI